jgi:hypothetical protein
MAVRRRPVYAEFTDKFGESQAIHRAHGRLTIKRKSPTVVLALTCAVGRHIGQRIREERIKAGIDMPSLAERAGLKGGKQAIYHAEQALNGGVRIGTLYAIASALGVSPFELLPSLNDAMREADVKNANVERIAV